MNETAATAFWKIDYDSSTRSVVIALRGRLDLKLARQMAVDTLTATLKHHAESFLADARKMAFSLNSGFDALSLPHLLLAHMPSAHRCMAVVYAPCPEAPNIFHFVEGMYRQAGYSVRFFTEPETARAWLVTQPPAVTKPSVCPPQANDFGLNRVRARQLWRFHRKSNPQHTQ